MPPTMKTLSYTLEITALTALLTLGHSAGAIDLETQQYNVNAAQKNLDEARENMKAASEKVKQENQRISQEQAILKDLQKKEATAKAEFTKTKADLEAQQKALDEAWKKK